jgi:hypothetical protein
VQRDNKEAATVKTSEDAARMHALAAIIKQTGTSRL